MPVIRGINPASGRIAGGTSVTITGLRFREGATVTFDGVAATNVVVVSSTEITCDTPAADEAGRVDVVVTIGTESATLTEGFTYIQATLILATPNYGPITGGTVVTLFGVNFVDGSTVTFGGSAATANFIDTQHISVETPNHATGFVDIVVTAPGGEETTLRNGFQYTLLTRGEDIRRNPSIQISSALNSAPKTCSFTVDGDSNIPTVGEKIEIVDSEDGDRLLFRGTVQTITQVYEGQTNQLAFKTTAIDFTWLANRRRPFGRYDCVSVSDIVVNLIETFCPGFTTNHVQTGLPCVKVTFDGTKNMSAALQQLAQMIGGAYFYFDEDQDFHFFRNQVGTTPIAAAGAVGPGTALTATEGDPIPVLFSFTTSYYLFASTFVYDNGAESGLSPFSEAVALAGNRIIEFSNIPIGAPAGALTVAKRRIYYIHSHDRPGPVRKFCEIEDNVTTAFNTYFREFGADVATVVAIADTVPLPRRVLPITNVGVVS